MEWEMACVFFSRAVSILAVIGQEAIAAFAVALG
jgi:hypothetical protein